MSQYSPFYSNERLNLLLQTICGTGIRVSELEYIMVETVKCGEAVVSLKGKTRLVYTTTLEIVYEDDPMFTYSEKRDECVNKIIEIIDAIVKSLLLNQVRNKIKTVGHIQWSFCKI